MKKIMFLIQKCIILIYCLLPLCMQGQRIVRVDVDSVACFDSVLIRVGFSEGNEIMVENLPTSLSHPEVAFLPDAIPCGSLGCSYRSPVTFSCFDSTATISSVNDINFVRLNIEHSYIGDIFIGITCPNGQRASLMNYSFYGSSDCSNSVPSEYCGWTLGYSVPISTYLGMPNDEQNSSQPCTSTAPGNEPGIGWNYCWSNNTENGYVYAGDDGIIYRIGNSHNGTIDSSDVAAGTQFYHPDQNFSSLIGCPLNGDWYIEVMDGWSGDNGYIFEWELSLDAELIPQDTCLVDSFSVSGYGITKVNDSTFIINAPRELTHDTTVYYNYHVYSSCGNDFDSTVALTFRAIFVHIDTTICDNHPLQIGTRILNETGEYTVTLTSAAQCDSIVEVSLTVLPHQEIHLYDTICKKDSYTINDTTLYQTGTYRFPHTNIFGCDSIETLHLWVFGDELKAVIKAIPLLVTPSEPDIRLYDCSHLNTSCRWIIDDRYFSERQFTYTYPVEADSLPVTLVAYSVQGCTDTAVSVIHIDRSTMFTPNVFTPNESTNNTWQPGMQDILTMEIWIYSREGQLVCHLEGTDAKWNGTNSKGEPCPQGAYVYTILYKTVAIPEKQNKTKGTILLLR